jgi:putative DNA primase/helicase
MGNDFDLKTPQGRAAALEHETEVARIRRAAYDVAKATPRLVGRIPQVSGLTLEQLREHVFPERLTLLQRLVTPIFRAGNIVQVYAIRGVGKTWFCQTLALIMATGIKALGFENPHTPCRVLYVDGEMASEDIQSRFHHLEQRLRTRLVSPLDVHANNLTIIGADWQEDFLPRLDTPEGQTAIEPYVKPVDCVIFDNRSALFDSGGEIDPLAWQPAQDYLLSLRRRGKLAVMVHHGNRQGGARGHSRPEDVIDVSIRLEQPADYSPQQGARFNLTFDKTRGISPGPWLEEFTTQLTQDGWKVESKERPDKLRALKDRMLAELANDERRGESPTSKRGTLQRIKGNQNDLADAFDELFDEGQIVKNEVGRIVVRPGRDIGQ